MAGDVDWVRLRKSVRFYVSKRLGPRASDDEIEDRTQECLLRVIDPETVCWDPGRSPVLFVFVCGVAWGDTSNYRRRTARKSKAMETLEQVAIEAPPPKGLEEGLAERLTLAALRDSLKDDPLVLAVFDLRVAGQVGQRARQTLGLSVREFRAATRRLGRRLKRFGQEFDMTSER